MFKTFKLRKWIILIFFIHLFSTKYASFFLKLQRILTLMIKRAKGFELMKMVCISNWSTFGSKVFLTLKVMDFENVFLTKNIHVHVIKGMNA